MSWNWIWDNRATRWWARVTAEPEPVEASAPWRIGLKNWGLIIARTIAGANGDDYGIVASSIAFAAFLSLLPLLSLVALTYSTLVSEQTVIGNVSALAGVLPDSAGTMVKHWLTNSLARRDAHGLAMLISAALTLFSGRRVGRSLMRGINIASGIEQDRGPLATQLVALVTVVAGAVLLLGALISMSALAIVRNLVPDDATAAVPVFRAVFWGSMTVGPALALLLVYRYVPARPTIAWRWVLPGTTVASLAWLAATFGFSTYVRSVANYGSIYGSLSAVIVLQLWLMLSAYILLFGAKLNTEAMRQAGRRWAD